MIRFRDSLFLASALALSVSQNASATYNANLQGVVVELATYTDSPLILFRLNNQPTSHPGCNATYFALDPTLPAEPRAQLYARLLTAHAMGQPVNIGYDNTGECANSYIRVYRVG